MNTGLVSIGAHTHNHADLRTLGSPSLQAELSRSDQIIQEELGLVPEHFAYPWGYWSSEAEAVVRERYTTAVLGAPSLSSSDGFDPHRLHRYPIQLSDGRRWFERRLITGLLAEESVRRRLRGYRGL